MKEKKISIVILTYNSEKDIMDCLASVYRYNDIGEALEVIVVDNNSDDVLSIFREIRNKYPDVLLIKNSENKGYGAGNNVGICVASAPIIMIMNPDVRLSEPVFSKALRVFDDYSVVMYGMKQKLPNGKNSASFAWTLLDNPLIAYLLGVRYCRPRDIYFQNKMFISGACFFVRKCDFLQVGLFDESLFLYAEEDDIRIRLLALGNRRVIYDKTVSYVHFFDNREVTLRKLHRLFTSKCYLCKKNGMNILKPYRWEIQYYTLSVLMSLNKKEKDKYVIYKEWLRLLRNNSVETILQMKF